MASEAARSFVGRRPGVVVAFWVLLAAVVVLAAPNLTPLAAEGQARLLTDDVDSRLAADLIARAWPDQAYDSMAVAALFRPEGLTVADVAYARRLAAAFAGPEKPKDLLRVLGPDSAPEVAARLVSKDQTLAMIALPISKPFVSPATQATVVALQSFPQRPGLEPPSGLEIFWTGDAVIGRDYMAGVQTSLDRAALATVVLLLGVLLVVYRSFWLAMVPLATIGISLLIARGMLAWMNLAGWEISSLVELFLIGVLFGSGTDFCLFLSWRFGEAWNPDDPVGAMELTMKRSSLALLTSAGTVIVGLSLMATNRFRLFSSTGPSVAVGLVWSLAATLTLTPALLILLARHRPQAFRGLTGPSSGFWEQVGRVAMAKPLLSWIGALIVMAPLVTLGLRSTMVQDLLTELPRSTPSSSAYRLVASKFDPGALGPLTIVLSSDADLRTSQGLALIDDLSRYLSRQKHVVEVRSATQPLGSTGPLDRARIASRLREMRDGFGQLVAGAGELETRLSEAALKLRAALWLEDKTGLSLLNSSTPAAPRAKVENSRGKQVEELRLAAAGAGKIVAGARRARRELGTILDDPVGQQALDRLLLDRGTIADHPEIQRSFQMYLTPDGHRARIDLEQNDRVFSVGAMNNVVELRRKIQEFLDEAEGPRVTSWIGGSDSESADVRALTRADLIRCWFVIPTGVFLVLIVALRDPLACVNLVATMLLTYAFALGATDLVFVSWLGAEGLDWKVPYFLFVLLVAVGVDYNVFLMARLHEESSDLGLRPGIVRAIGQTGGLITSAAAITACSFASFLASPLASLRQLGFALVVGITVDALLVRPVLVPCGHWLLRRLDRRSTELPAPQPVAPHGTPSVPHTRLAVVSD